jgi:hypothetical protein
MYHKANLVLLDVVSHPVENGDTIAKATKTKQSLLGKFNFLFTACGVFCTEVTLCLDPETTNNNLEPYLAPWNHKAMFAAQCNWATLSSYAATHHGIVH